MNWHICHKRKLLILFVFSTYLPVFLLEIQSKEFVGCGIWFFIQWVLTLHTFDGPHYPKNKKYLKKCDDDVIITFFHVFHHHVFSCISCFWGSGVHQKYAVWVIIVLIGCGIKFCIQRALPLKIWVKTHGDMSKIQTKK